MKLVAIEIVRDFRGGSSLPVLIQASNDRLYVVKWNGTAEGSITSVADWITTSLARLAGIPVPHTSLILIMPDLCQQPMDPEIKDLVFRSIGTNLAIEYLPMAIPFKPNQLQSIDENLRNKIFLFDLLMLNIDRVDSNPNMLFNNRDLFCIDFSASMSIRELLIKRSFSEQSLLSLIRRHPFYSETISVEQIDCSINHDAVNKIVEKVPDEWLNETSNNTTENRVQLTEAIVNIFQNKSTILQKRLDDLKQIPFLSIDERRKLRLDNRNKFKAKFGL